MHYIVNNKIFYNKLQAASCAIADNANIHFDMYESAFDRCNWLEEPLQTWDELLDIRANQLAAKGKPIVLYFSGGTDSYTIYKVFERNNIHIDMIYLRRRKTDIDGKINQGLLELLNSGVYDPTTKIIIREDNAELFEQAYDSENWVWDKQIRTEFSVGFTGDEVSQNYIAQLLGTDDFVAVMGLEKSQLFFDRFRVHSFLPDHWFHRIMGFPNLECFFITPDLPELYVKQCYLMLNWIRRHHPTATPQDLFAYNEFQNPDKFSWDDYAAANGRFGELSISGPLHSAWQGMKLHLPTGKVWTGSEHQGPGSNWFTSLNGTKTFYNFVNGLQNFASDPIGKYLLQDPINPYKMKMFTSKPYRLRWKM